MLVVAVLPVVFSMAVVASRDLLLPLIALDAMVLAVAVIDAVTAAGAVEIVRECKPLQAVGRPFQVSLRVTNVGRRGLMMRLTDDPPEDRSTELPFAFELPTGSEWEGEYEAVVNRRGHHQFGPVAVRWRSTLGLWERQKSVIVPTEFRVYPDFKQMRHHGLQARLSERRVPVRSARRLGGENEFERLRHYVPGDPYRHIDWKATARRQRIISREFGQERNQNVIFLLDAGRMMSVANDGLSAFDHALNAALMMSHTALRHGDRVGLLVYDSQVRVWLPPGGGTRSIQRLIRGTYDVFPSLEESDHPGAFRFLAQRVRQRSLVVCMTAVIDEPNARLSTSLVAGLKSRHLPLCVWIRDESLYGLLDGEATHLDDKYARCAAADVIAWREQALDDLRQKGALVVDCPPTDLSGSLLARYLEIKARRLL